MYTTIRVCMAAVMLSVLAMGTLAVPAYAQQESSDKEAGVDKPEGTPSIEQLMEILMKKEAEANARKAAQAAKEGKDTDGASAGTSTDAPATTRPSRRIRPARPDVTDTNPDRSTRGRPVRTRSTTGSNAATQPVGAAVTPAPASTDNTASTIAPASHEHIDADNQTVTEDQEQTSPVRPTIPARARIETSTPVEEPVDDAHTEDTVSDTATADHTEAGTAHSAAADVDAQTQTHGAAARMPIPRRGPSRGGEVSVTAGNEAQDPETAPIIGPVDPDEKILQFSFTDAPYGVVIDYIEKISGLPVLGDRASLEAAGTLTYFNRDLFTLHEALEELNLILDDKGFQIVKVGRHLEVLRTADTLKTPMRDFIGREAFEAAVIRPVEMVRLFEQLDDLDPQRVVDLVVQVMPLDSFKISVFSGDTIMMQSNARQIGYALKLIDRINQLDRPDDRPVEFFKIKHMPAAEMLTKLDMVLPQQTPLSIPRAAKAPRGKQPDQPTLSSFVDADMYISESTNELIVRARPSMMKEIKEWIGKLDVPQINTTLKLEIIPLEYADATMVAQLANQMLTALDTGDEQQKTRRRRAPQGGSDAVTADITYNRLIVLGEVDEIDRVKHFVEQLDKPVEESPITIITLENASSDNVFKVLTQLYSSTKAQPPVAADAEGNTLVTWATGDELSRIRDIAKELDREPPTGRHIVTLKNATASLVAKNLQQLNAGRKPNEQIKIVSDDATGTLVVECDPGLWEELSAIIDQMDSDLAAFNDSRVVQLRHGNAVMVAKAVTDAMTARYGGKAPVAISPNAEANMVIVAGNTNAVEEAMKLVSLQDMQQKTEVRVFRLKHIEAQPATELVNQLISAATGGGKPVHQLASDVRTNAIILTSPAAQIDIIEQIIKEIDVPAEAESAKTVEVVELENAPAQEIASSVSAAISGQGKKGPGTIGELSVTVTPNNAANTVLLAGPPQQIEQVKQLIAKLDAISPGQPQNAQFDLFYATPSEVAATINSLYGGDKTTPVTTVADDWSGTLFVSATKKDMAGIEEIITKLEQAPSEDAGMGSVYSNVEFMPLQADAWEVAGLIEDILSAGAGGKKGAGGPSVEASTYGNYLVISGTTKEIEMVKSYAHQFEEFVSQKPRTLAIRTLDKGSVDEMAELLRQFFPTVSDKQIEIKHLDTNLQEVNQVDNETTSPATEEPSDSADSNDTSAAVPSNPLFGGVMHPLAMMLGMTAGQVDLPAISTQPADDADASEASHNKVTIGVDKNNQALIIRASDRDIELIDKLMDELRPAMEEGLQYEVVKVETDPATVAQQVMTVFNEPSPARPQPQKNDKNKDDKQSEEEKKQQQQAAAAAAAAQAAQRVRIVPAPEIKSVIITGNRRHFEKVKTLIELFDRVTPPEVETVPLENARAADVVSALTQAYPSEPGKGTSLRFHADEQSNSILIAGPESQRQRVLQTIKELENLAEKQQQAQRRSYDTQYADPTQVAQKLNDFFSGDPRARRGELKFVGDQASGKLLIRAPAELNEQIDQFIKMIDTEDADPNAQVRVHKLQHASAQSVATIIQRMRGQMGMAAGPMAVEVDERNNSLIYSGPPQMVELVEKLIAQVDVPKPEVEQPAPAQKVTEIVELGKVDSGTLTRAVQQKHGNEPQMIIDEGTNTIIVTATAEQIADVKSLIEELSGLQRTEDKTRKKFPLKYSDPNTVARVIQESFPSRGVPVTERVSVTADWTTSSVVVGANAEQMAEVESLIAELDQPAPEGSQSTHIVRLDNTDPHTIYNIIRQQFDDLLRQTRQRSAQVVITPDRASRSLIIQADQQDFEKINALIEKLDVAGEGTPTHILDLGDLDGGFLQRAVRMKYANNPPDMQYDSESNTLVVTCDDQMLAEIEQLKTALTPKVSEKDRTTKRYAIQYADARIVHQAVSSMFSHHGIPRSERAEVVYDWSTNAVLVSALPSVIEKIDALVAELDQERAEGTQATEIIEIKNARVWDIAGMIRQRFPEKTRSNRQGETEIGLIENRANNTLIVSANERNLQLVQELVAQIDIPAKPQTTRVIELDQVDGGTFINAVRQKFPNDTPGMVQDRDSNTVIVTCDETQWASIQELQQQLADVTGSGDTQTKRYPIQYADARIVHQAVSSMFSHHGIPRSERAEVVYDWSTNAVLVSAIPSVLEEIDALVAELDQERAEGTQTTEIIEIKNARVWDIAGMIRQRFPEKTRSNRQGETEIGLIENRANNTLIVSANERNFEMVRHLVEQLDIPATPQTTRVIELGQIDGNTFMQAVRNKFPNDRPDMVHDRDSNTIIVTCDESQVETIYELKDQLLGISQIAQKQQQRFALTHADPNIVANAIRQVFASRTMREAERAEVVPDTVTNSVIISANEQQMTEIEKLVKEMDQPNTVTGRTQHIVKLKHVRSERLVQVLNEQFNQTRMRTRSGQMPVVFSADPSSNQLIVTSTDAEFEDIQTLIEALDSPPERAADQHIRIVPLQNANLWDTFETVREMLRKPGSRWWDPDELAGGVRLAQATAINSLVVIGPQDQLDYVEELITNLDGKTTNMRKPFIVALEYVDAQEMADIVQGAFSQSSGPSWRRGNDEQLSVEAETNSNSLIVSCPESKFPDIEEFIKKLDTPDGAGDVHFISLKSANAADVADTLNEFFEEQRRSGRRGRSSGEQVKIIPDEATNTLLVRAKAGDLATITDMVTRLDTEEAEGLIEIETIQLTRGDAEEVGPMVQKLLNDAEQARSRSGRGGRSSSPDPVTISVEPRSNTLLIAGSHQKRQEVKELITKLELLGPPGPRRMFILPIDNLDPEQAKQLLEDMIRQNRSGASAQPFGLDGLSIRFAEGSDDDGGDDGGSGGDDDSGNTRVVSATSSHIGTVTRTAAIHLLLATSLGADQAATQPAADTARAIPATPTVKNDESSGMTDLTITGEPEITALPEQRALLITADPQDYLAIKELMRRIDISMPKPTTKVFKLENAKAVDLAPMLDKLFADRSKAMRTKRPEDQISVTADPNSNSLLVTATEQSMVEVNDLITRLDVSGQIADVVDFRIFTLENGQATKIAETLEEMFQKRLQMQGVTDTPYTITAEPRTNTIVVTAPKNYFDTIEQLLEVLDSVPAFSTAHVEMIRLQQASATDLASVLEEILSAEGTGDSVAEQINRLQLATAGDDPMIELDLEKPINIVPDDSSESILLSSSEENLVALRAIVNMLDVVPLAHDLRMRIYPLNHADADEVADSITDLFDRSEDLTAVPGTKRDEGGVPETTVGEALVYRIATSADVRTNTLVVSGPETSLALVDLLIEQLDSESAIDEFPTNIVFLEHTDAERIATLLQEIHDARMQRAEALGAGRTAERERVHIQADPRSNALLISATRGGHEEIVKLAMQLDSADAKLSEPRLVKIENGSADNLASVLQQLWDKRISQLGDADTRNAPVILSDARSNMLIIAANPGDFDAIKNLAEKIDTAPLSPAMGIHLVSLQHHDAGQLGDTIDNIFEQRLEASQVRGQEPDPSQQIAVVVDEVTNTLLIAASKSNFQEVEQLIEKLDVEPPLEGVIQLFTLEKVDAKRVSDILSDLFEQGLYRPGSLGAKTDIQEEREKVAIVVDERTNTLIVSCSKENFSIVEKLITQMDREGTELFIGRTRLYNLQNADAEKMADMLEDLFDQQQQDREERGFDELSTTIIADTRSNTLIVSASPENHREAERLIKELDGAPLRPSVAFKMYKVQKASAIALQPMLDELFSNRDAISEDSEVTIVAEPRTNTLIVAASREEHEIFADLLGDLDNEEALRGRFRIFPIQKGNAEDIAEVLEDIAPSDTGEDAVTISVDERTNAVVVAAEPNDMKEIANLIEKLDETIPKRMRLELVKLQYADAEDTADTLTDLLEGNGSDDKTAIMLELLADEARTARALREDIQISPDPRTNSLMVVAPPESMDLLTTLITQLDSLPFTSGIEIFTLENAEADTVKEILEEIFGIGKKDDEERSVLEVARGPGGNLQLGGAGAGPAPAGPTGTTAGGPGGRIERESFAVAIDQRSNSVIVTGSEYYIEQAASLIEKLDSKQITKRMTAVIPLRNAEPDDVESAVKDLFEERANMIRDIYGEENISPERVFENEVNVVADEKSRKIIVEASPALFDSVKQVIDELDEPPPQVMIQALLVEVSISDSTQIGFEWAFEDLRLTEGTGDWDTVTGTDVGAAGAAGSLGGFTFSLQGEDIELLLRALQSDGKLNVLSRPQIMARDNVEASISVGSQVPIVTSTITSGDTGNTTGTVSYEDVGVKLAVTPHVNPDGYINLEVAPEISGVAESTVQVAGQATTVINETLAETEVTVKDGETVVIGGLIRNQTQVTESKVPILGDIPLLGFFFRSSSYSEDKNELLIILTPHLISDAEAARKMSIRERDLTGLMPTEVLTSPLMGKLRAHDEFHPQDLEAEWDDNGNISGTDWETKAQPHLLDMPESPTTQPADTQSADEDNQARGAKPATRSKTDTGSAVDSDVNRPNAGRNAQPGDKSSSLRDPRSGKPQAHAVRHIPPPRNHRILKLEPLYKHVSLAPMLRISP